MPLRPPQPRPAPPLPRPSSLPPARRPAVVPSCCDPTSRPVNSPFFASILLLLTTISKCYSLEHHIHTPPFPCPTRSITVSLTSLLYASNHTSSLSYMVQTSLFLPTDAAPLLPSPLAPHPASIPRLSHHILLSSLACCTHPSHCYSSQHLAACHSWSVPKPRPAVP